MANRFNIPITQLVNDDASSIGSGWLLNFYVTGTTTRKDTFSDNALTSANANPVVSDSSGRFADIFLESGTYKVVLTDASAVEKWTADPVAGSVGSSGAVDEKTASYTITIADATKIIAVDSTTGAATITLLAAAVAGDGFEVTVKKTDSSSNAVTIDGDGSETIDGSATYAITRQYEATSIRSDGTNWLILSRTALNNISEDTTPQLGGDLDANGSQIQWSQGADVASATALAVLTDGNYFDVTGTTTITSINTTGGAGTVIKLHFDGALTLTHHATNLILPSGANITTAAGDEAEFVEYGSGTYRCTNYMKASGEPVISAGGYELADGPTAITAVTSLAVTGLAAGYDYIFVLEAFCPTSDAQVLWMRFSDDGGSTYEAGAADYQWGVKSSTTNYQGASDSQIDISGDALGNDATNVSHVEITMPNPNASGEMTTCSWFGFTMDAQATPETAALNGGARFLQGTDAVDAVQFLWSGGSTFKAQGDITTWRRKRS